MSELTTLLSQLTGREFECFLRDLWDTRGWDTRLTEETGDDGVDVVLERYEFYQQRKLIQTKCIQPDDKLSRSTVQQYSYLLHEDNVDEAILVTTGGFTEGARQSAAKANLKLIDGEMLENLVFDTLDISGSEFNAESYVPEYDFESTTQPETTKETDSILTTEGESIDLENVPSELRTRIERLSNENDIYNRLLATIEPDGFDIDTLLLILFQLFRGEDPFHLLVCSDSGIEYRPILNRVIELQKPKPTEHINCLRTDVETVIGSSDARGGYPGLLAELDDGLLVMSQFSVNEPLQGELVEPLQSGVVRSAKWGNTESTSTSTSVFAVGTPKYGKFDPDEPLEWQLNITSKLLKSFDGFIINDINGDTKSNVIHNLPSVNPVTTSEGLDVENFRVYRMAANTIDPEVSENILDLVYKIELKIKEVNENSWISASSVTNSLLRAAKASARMQLRDTVCKADIYRASIVLPYPLVGGELTEIVQNPVTYSVGGDFDAEVVETGKSREELDEEQQDDMENMKGLIERIASEFDDGAPVSEVLNRAHEIGMNVSKAEQEMQKLRRKGEIYEPKKDYLRPT